MNAGKKLLATLFTTVIFIICLGSTVYATELDLTEIQPVQEVVTEGTDHAIEDIQEAENQRIKEQAAEETLFAVKEGQMSDSSDLTKEEAALDGQSQVFSIKPKEEEINDGENTKEKSIDKEKTADEKKDEDKKNEEKIDKDKKDEADKKENKKEEKEEKKEKKEKPSYSKEDLRLLAGLIYSEAGNQPYNGMLAVANIVINRAKSSVFGHADTIREVIYDKKWCVQFTVTIKDKKSGKSILDKALECYDTGKFTGSNKGTKKESMQRAIKAAKAALEGENNIGGYLCFRADNKYAASIKKKYDYKMIGNQIFYRTK